LHCPQSTGIPLGGCVTWTEFVMVLGTDETAYEVAMNASMERLQVSGSVKAGAWKGGG
jgi:hypothetical protein